MNSPANDSSFRQWRSKRERDPSEGRMRKRLITSEKLMSQRANEKENQQQPIGQPATGDKEHGLRCESMRCESMNNSQSCLSDQNSNLNSTLNNNLSSTLNNNLNNQLNNNLNSNLNSVLNGKTNGEQSPDVANRKSGLSMELSMPTELPCFSDPMHSSLSSPITLKQKLVSLNNSKFVIEEDVENEELATPILNEEFDDSDYDYDGEDLSENDENYFANDYPDEHDYNELDFYRDYENDDEREMLEKFEKSWNNDGSDHYSDEDDD